jgi:hypothetical protein
VQLKAFLGVGIPGLFGSRYSAAELADELRLGANAESL